MELKFEFGKDFPKAMETIKQCNILLIGNTGVGKSTLIRTLLNLDEPINDRVTRAISSPYKHPSLPIALYDSPGLELSEKKSAKSTKNEVIGFIKKQNKLEPQEQIHAVWYCVNSQVVRAVDIDKKWIEDVANLIPVLVVITKSLDKENEKTRALFQGNPHIRHISSVMAEATPTLNGDIKPHGWEDLLKNTESLLNEIAENAIQNAIDQKTIVAVHWCALGLTGAIGSQFSPLGKSALLLTVQIWILHDISKNFGHKFLRKDIEQLLEDASICGSLALLDPGLEYLLSHLPNLDYNNIQSVQQVIDHIINTLKNTSESIPFKDNVIDILQEVSSENFVAGLPVLSVLSVFASTFSTIVLSAIWIEIMQDRTRDIYEGKDPKDPLVSLLEKLKQVKDFIVALLKGQPPAPEIGL